MGGNTRVVISGAAPLADHVEEFLRTVMCSPVLQGYGRFNTLALNLVSVFRDDNKI